MLIYIDRSDQWNLVSSQVIDGEIRYYYLAEKPYRMLLVCRAEKLGLCLHRVVDASLGYEYGWQGFSRNPGELQEKITVYRIVSGNEEYDFKLSALLFRALKDE